MFRYGKIIFGASILVADVDAAEIFEANQWILVRKKGQRQAQLGQVARVVPQSGCFARSKKTKYQIEDAFDVYNDSIL